MKPKIGQYLTTTFGARGGGERVQRSLFKLFGATVYTIKKRLKGKEFKEIGSEKDRKIMMRITKT